MKNLLKQIALKFTLATTLAAVFGVTLGAVPAQLGALSTSTAEAAYYTPPSTTVGASFSRSSDVRIPNDWRPDRSYPLIIFLHPYGSTGSSFANNLVASRTQNFDDGTIVFVPDGVLDGASRHWRYWDLSAGTDFDYLAACIAEIRARFNISWVAIVGYSNGGFMALQFAQQHPSLVHALLVMAAAGGTNDPTTPGLTIPLHLIIGDTDATVPPAGDATASALPGALNGHGGVGSPGFVSATATITAQAARNGVTGSLGSAGTAFDLITGGTPSGAGAEATSQIYSGTTSQSALRLTTLAGTTHGPIVNWSGFRFSDAAAFTWLVNNHRSP